MLALYAAFERTAASPRTASITLSRLDLIRRIEAGQGDFLVFALTPPRLATERDQAQDIADATIARLLPLDLDGLILYDIDDETDRNPAICRPGRHPSSSTGRSANTRRPSFVPGFRPKTPHRS